MSLGGGKSSWLLKDAPRLKSQYQIRRNNSEHIPLLAMPTCSLDGGTPKTGCDFRLVLTTGFGLWLFQPSRIAARRSSERGS